MSVKRRPKLRPFPAQITARAVAAFVELKKLEEQCTCTPRDWTRPDWKQCSACEQWWDQHDIIFRELRMPPWRWPCVMNPEEPNPWPANSPRARRWRPNSEAVAVWLLLEEVAREI